MSCWIGVVANIELVRSAEITSWWCLPVDAMVGDTIYLYCPVSTSQKYHGLFAKAVVSQQPSEAEPLNAYCRIHSNRLYGRMYYVPIDIVERYEKRVSARDIKCDPYLGNSSVARRNFQGTAFLLTPREETRLSELVLNRGLG